VKEQGSHDLVVEYGVQSMVYKVWCTKYGAQSMVYKVWCTKRIGTARAGTRLLLYSKAIHQLQLTVQLLSKVLILDRKGNAKEQKC
jgi:hypothetical protein